MLLKITIILKIILTGLLKKKQKNKKTLENSTNLSLVNIADNLDLLQCFGNGDNKENDFCHFNLRTSRLILHNACMQHCDMKA